MAEITETLRVDTSDAKYTVVQLSNGTSHALRNGEEWALYPEGGSVGNLALALANDLLNAQRRIEELTYHLNMAEAHL